MPLKQSLALRLSYRRKQARQRTNGILNSRTPKNQHKVNRLINGAIPIGRRKKRLETNLIKRKLPPLKSKILLKVLLSQSAQLSEATQGLSVQAN